MNRAERNALAELLSKIADKLEGAEKEAEEASVADLAKRGDAITSRYPYMVGALSQITKSSGADIRAAIRSYLVPKGRHL